jgi:hypothetical protein
MAVPAFTLEIIHAAFRKTRVWPFNPNVVTKAMMAPSKEISCEGFLPVEPLSPIKLVAKFLWNLSIWDPDDDVNMDVPNPTNNKDVDMEEPDLPSGLGPVSSTDNILPPAYPAELPPAVTETLQCLSETSLACLITSTKPSSSSQLQHNVTEPISLLKHHYLDLLKIVPHTGNEQCLLEALQTIQSCELYLKCRLLELQAGGILNELYCNVLRGQLTHHENKKNAPKGKGWLVGDGMPHLLSGDEFYEKVVEFTKEQEKTEREKEARLQA